VPSGVVTVLVELCRGWPTGDGITILLNPEHWAEQYLHCELKERSDIDVLKMPATLSGLWLIHHLAPLPRILRLLLRVLCLPLTVIQMLLMMLWMVVWLRRNGVDGILSHAGGWPGGMLNCWMIYAGFLAAVPHRVLVIHNTPFIPRSALERFLFRWKNWLMGKAASRIVTVSDACRDSLEQDVNFGKALDVIYNGIPIGVNVTNCDSCELTTAWEKQYPTIAFVGELHPRKGVHVLLDAFLHVKSPAELVLIGNGDDEYTAELKTVASASEWPVHFLGFRSDVLDMYPQMDILVLPSLNFESFGMVIVEAMRASVPVICSDFGGMKEVVADGVTGLVVPAGNVNALSVAIERLLSDDGLRRKLGQNGQTRLNTHFSSQGMVKNYVNLFHIS